MMIINDESTEEYIPDPNSDEETLRELIAGILLLGITVSALLLALNISLIAVWCYCIGISVAVVWAVHMRKGIRAAFSLNEADAIVQLRKSAVVRYLIAVAFMLAIYFRLTESERIYAIGYVVGIYMLKPGAYLQPVIHRIFVFLHISKPYPKGKPLEEDSDILASKDVEA